MTTNQVIRIVYTNYKGDTRVRQLQPIRIHFSSTKWHPKPQWLLDALDLERNEERSFAIRDIKAWF
jgi:predicted DNA-binding transcriptional regulator YafY